jgi:DNA-binding SARP family transcriptional activator
LLQQAESAAEAGYRDEAMNVLRSALALWRGPVLSGEGGGVIEAAAVALTERRLAAFEQLTELRLETGEPSGLVAELREYIDQYPLRETLHGQLMIALYRSGRQAEALEEYGRVRELLAEELGTDPGPGLAQVYEAVPGTRLIPRSRSPCPPGTGPRAARQSLRSNRPALSRTTCPTSPAAARRSTKSLASRERPASMARG